MQRKEKMMICVNEGSSMVTNVPLYQEILITGEAMHVWRQEVYGKSLHLLLNIAAATAATAAKLLQSCLTLCNPVDGSPPGSAVPGILQARTLEWVAISFSNAWKWKVKVKTLSRVRLFATPWTAAYQAPPSIGFSRQEYWNGVPSEYKTTLKNRVYF